MFGLTYVPTSIYDRETTLRCFQTIRNILRFLNLAKSFFKGRNMPKSLKTVSGEGVYCGA